MTIYIIVLLAFLTHVGFAGSRLAVPLFAVDQGATPFVVGTIVALYALFPAVLALAAGRMTDRFGFKIPMLFGTGGVCVALIRRACGRRWRSCISPRRSSGSLSWRSISRRRRWPARLRAQPTARAISAT